MEPKLKPFLIFIFILISLFITNCSNINTISMNNGLTNTQVGDIFLDDQIKVEDIKVIETENGKSYNVLLKNLMWFDINLEVKMDFFNNDGIKTDNPWGWKPLKLEQGQADWGRFIAPNKDIRNFKLFIKKASK